MPSNNSFKPNSLRYINNMADGACHVVAFATQVGLIQALGLKRIITMTDAMEDPPLDADELLAVASLTRDEIQAIDRALVTNNNAQWRKVAYVVSTAMDAYPDLFHDIPDIFYAQRVKALVEQGLLESQGNLSRMRFSEVRLAGQGLPQ